MIENARKYDEEEMVLREARSAKDALERDCLQIKEKQLEDTDMQQDSKNAVILKACEDLLQWIVENPFAEQKAYEDRHKEFHSLASRFFKKLKIPFTLA